MPQLSVNSVYALVVELSEESGDLDGAAAQACAPFGLAIKTWDSHQLCSAGNNLPDLNSWSSSIMIGAEPTPQTFALATVTGRASLALQGSGPADVTITLDYSDAFYRSELALVAKAADSTSASSPSDRTSGGASSDDDGPDGARVLDSMSILQPDEVDLSRKQSTTLRYRALSPGSYELRFRQADKPHDCRGALTVTVTARSAAS